MELCLSVVFDMTGLMRGGEGQRDRTREYICVGLEDRF